MPSLILASGSPYRQTLLSRLGLEFIAHAPDVDEAAKPHETPTELAKRLARNKARALKSLYPEALIIGSDQVAWLDGTQLTKPGNFANAFAQLQRSSCKTVTFYTGLCLYNSHDDSEQLSVETYRATFRPLSDEQLRDYLNRDQPYDCAGSFKCEGLGISLFESLAGDDPNTLIGLPLIRLTQMLSQAGLDPLGNNR